MRNAVEDICTFSYFDDPTGDDWMKTKLFHQQQVLMCADAIQIFPYLMEAVKLYINE